MKSRIRPQSLEIVKKLISVGVHLFQTLEYLARAEVDFLDFATCWFYSSKSKKKLRLICTSVIHIANNII